MLSSLLSLLTMVNQGARPSRRKTIRMFFSTPAPCLLCSAEMDHFVPPILKPKMFLDLPPQIASEENDKRIMASLVSFHTPKSKLFKAMEEQYAGGAADDEMQQVLQLYFGSVLDWEPSWGGKDALESLWHKLVACMLCPTEELMVKLEQLRKTHKSSEEKAASRKRKSSEDGTNEEPERPSSFPSVLSFSWLLAPELPEAPMPARRRAFIMAMTWGHIFFPDLAVKPSNRLKNFFQAFPDCANYIPKWEPKPEYLALVENILRGLNLGVAFVTGDEEFDAFLWNECERRIDSESRKYRRNAKKRG
eukprot:m.262395 g.262395  ORF g.262395 m.262395 type:complete len:306 (-) comp22760_c0_seq40:249-1166(-)